MEPVCPECGEHLDSEWIFCPRCGARVVQPAEPKHEQQEPEPAPVTGAFSGLYFGLVAAPVMVIVGTMLCLTGLGAFLGIPMIIGGILAPLAGPMFGMGAVKGKFL
ncbi:MAG: zinc ribbon domain-containing protein [Acidobacteriota bacterium]